jgi:hypothetical protein
MARGRLPTGQMMDDGCGIGVYLFHGQTIGAACYSIALPVTPTFAQRLRYSEIIQPTLEDYLHGRAEMCQRVMFAAGCIIRSFRPVISFLADSVGFAVGCKPASPMAPTIAVDPKVMAIYLPIPSKL